MHDINAILEQCFEELSHELEVERVSKIPFGDDFKQMSVPVWRVISEADVNGRVIEVESYIGFPKGFPYELPFVIVSDDRFRYLPHISLSSKKLCLYEDGIVYNAENIYGLVRETISKTRKWVEKYYNQDNTAEYASEINSYWNEKYDGENEVETRWILLGTFPAEDDEYVALTYSVDFMGTNNKYFDQTIVCKKGDPILENIKTRSHVTKQTVCFLNSFSIPSCPPYSITGSEFIANIKDEEERKKCLRHLDKRRKGVFLFSIGLPHILGGVSVPQIPIRKNGYRPGILSVKDILTKFDFRNKKLNRIAAYVYDDGRIAQRTAGEKMKAQRFVVAGLGSIGSNLCYYLNGYNNAEFALIDSDTLTTDNIGRHLLGFGSIEQLKVEAVANYLTTYRPDRKVSTSHKHLQDVDISEINKASALFICTGDVMSEQWLLSNIEAAQVNVPTFILWLEPYAISGIMLYASPDDKENLSKILERSRNGFKGYGLIEETEYANEEKLLKRDAGCNGKYSIYSANDVTLFLSAMFPIIDKLLEAPNKSKCYRWVGNVEIAKQKNINLVGEAAHLSKNLVQELTI